MTPASPIDADGDASGKQLAHDLGGYLLGLFKAFMIVSAFGVGSVVATAMPMTWYRMQTSLGLFLVVPYGLVVALQVFWLRRLDRSPSSRVRDVGRVLSTVFQYTALFQGVLATATILWLVAIAAGWDTVPSASEFPEDFVFGVGYVSCFVFGAVGVTVLSGATGVGSRVTALLYTAGAVAAPILTLTVFGAPVRSVCATNPSIAIAVELVYFLAASVLGMALLEQQVPATRAVNTRVTKSRDSLR